jgi:Mg2+/Co2+ transporter CorB
MDSEGSADWRAWAALWIDWAGQIDRSWFVAAAILALLLLSAFFSGAETALTAMSRATMHRLAEQGSPRARAALKLGEDSERLIGAILLGNNAVNILAASLATALFTAWFGESGVAYATLAMTALVLVFSEVLPKTYAITNPEPVAMRVAPAITVLVRLFAPVVGVVRIIVRATLRVFGVRADPDAHALAAFEQIRGAIDLHHSEGLVEKDDRDRLIAALDLRERGVAEVMVHRRNIASISADESPEDILTYCLQSRHTRIPLWRDQPENIVGVIHAKDLLRAVDRLIRESGRGVAALAELDVMDVAMEPWFVPDTTSLDDQMREFLKRRSHFALVVDEYGDLQGLITLEDILEEIVGDIADEHDAVSQAPRPEPDGSFVVEGVTSIRDLNRQHGWRLPDDVANTVAGLVIHEAQTIPTVGQVFRFHDFRFEVLERNRNQITRLRLKPMGRAAAR